MKDFNRPFLIKAVGIALTAYAIISALTLILLYMLPITYNGTPPELPPTAILPLLAAPILIIAAFGLFRRKAWARFGAILGLLLMMGLVVISIIGRPIGVFDLIWIGFSAVMIFLLLTDAGVKAELSR